MLKEKYDYNGYVIIPKLATSEQLVRFMSFAIHIQPEPDIEQGFVDRLLHEGFIENDKKDHSIIHRFYQTLKDSSALNEIVFSPITLHYAKKLLGLSDSQSVYVSYHVCRLDPPHDERFTYRWHQESFYSIYQAAQVSLWMPLIAKSTKANGTMSILKGSHTFGEISHWLHKTEGGHEQKYIEEADLKIDLLGEEFIEIEAGDACFFHHHLPHRSNKNISQDVRYTLVAAYVNPYDPRFKITSESEMIEYHRKRCVNG